MSVPQPTPSPGPDSPVTVPAAAPRGAPVRAPAPASAPAESRHNATLGATGETLACRHLVRRGMFVLDRNWRCDAGEIDVVLRDGDVLVVCEVKTRSSHDFGSPFEAVTPVKVARLRRLAARWLAAHEVSPRDVRIDMVGIVIPRRGPVEIEHVEGIG